jgi:uncharacterized protein
MSEENVKAFERAVDAYNRRDVDAFVEEFDPEAEWYSLTQVMFGGEQSVYRGHRGIREGVRDIDEALAEMQVECSEIRELGETLVVIGRVRGRGRASGVELDSPINWVVDFEGGKVARMRDYLDARNALEAAGLREQAMSQENVENVRRGYEAWNRNDVHGFLRNLDPNIEWRPRLGAAGIRATLYRGHEGVLTYKREVEEALGPVHVDVLSIEDLGDRMLAHIRATGQGSASGAKVEAEAFHLWTMDAGRAVGFATYERRDQAIEAAGLRE